MTPLIDSLYTTRKSTDLSGQVIEIQSEIPRSEGRFMYDLIAEDPSIRRTLEVGCAHGLSSLHICEALRGREGANHTILDPFQRSYWNGLGILHLDKSGVDFYQLVEEKSEFYLPKLVETQAGTFDFIFIDGVHTFDHALIDAFYSLRLLRVGGLLVLDDCDIPALEKLAAYLKNYPCLELHGRHDRFPPPAGLAGKIKESLRPLAASLPAKLSDRYRRRYRAVAYKKISDDERLWNWYAPF